MSKSLRELEKRLKEEPDNVGLRVTVAGALREDGRHAEAVELYRSVATAYRDQGRTQQAIAVCRSILEIAPDDVRCHALLASLVAGQPGRASQDTAAVIAAQTQTPPPVSPATPRPHAASGTHRAVAGSTPLGPSVPSQTTPPPTLRPQSSTSPPTPRSQSTSAVTPPPTPRPQSTSAVTPPPTPRPQSTSAVTPPPTPRPRSTSAAQRTVSPSSPAPPPAPVARAQTPVPERRSSLDETPLPRPVPYHVADPTTSSLKKLSDVDLPAAEGVETRPGSEPGTRPEVSGIANAARRISATLIGAATEYDGPYDRLDIASELDTRQRPRIETGELAKISMPPPTAPIERVDIDRIFERLECDEDAVTPVPGIPTATDNDTEEALTVPIDLPDPTRVREPKISPPPASLGSPGGSPITGNTQSLLASPFFMPLPPPRRGAVLSRFLRKTVAPGTTVIRQGEADHPLVLVGRGRLEIKTERADGSVVLVGTLGAGDFVGEVALLSRTPSASAVIAVSECELLTLAPRDFYEIAGAFPALWAQLKDSAERRTREHVAKLKR